MPGAPFPVRVARPAGRPWNVSKTLLQTIGIWGLALWILPQLIHRLEFHWGIPGFSPRALFGWLLFGVASALGLWSGATMAWLGEGTPLPFDTARRLVIDGPYCRVRNPMAVAGLTQGFAAGLILGSYAVLLYAMAGGLLWQLAVRPMEEADLARRFGDPYARYCSEVRCWLPRVSPWKPGPHTPC